MKYSPTIFRFNGENNPFDIFYSFIRDWYEIGIEYPLKINFAELLSVKISDNINKMLNLLTHLNCSTVSGKKRIAYNGFKYIFYNQNFEGRN